MDETKILYHDPETGNLIDHEGMEMRVASGVPATKFTAVCANCTKATIKKRPDGTSFCTACKEVYDLFSVA